MTHKSSARRGILLLLILALLAMFGMVAVAFVVLSNQSLRGSKISQKQEQSYHPPENDLNEAFMQVARGTMNSVSKLRPHSLLEDIYGNGNPFNPAGTPEFNYGTGPVTARIVTSGYCCGNQLTEITYQLITNKSIDPSQPLIADPFALRRIGCPVSFVSGPLRGLTSRIVSVNPTTGNPQITTSQNGLVPQQGDMFIINGMPFSGTGFGFKTTTGRLDQLFDVKLNQLAAAATTPNTTAPLALLPFSAGNINPLGHTNEDYDAADFQNMLLGTPPIDAAGTKRIIPSMHRPALVNYWYQQLFTTILTPLDANFSTMTPEQKWYAILHPYGYDNLRATMGDNPKFRNITTGDFIVAFKRNIIARPLPEDHPQFNGSNPASRNNPVPALMMGQLPYYWERDGLHWDVDTDGDGIPDANWLDIGLPVRTTTDGRKYKPLVAIYCLDLDGRLNLNAHGNVEQTNPNYYNLLVETTAALPFTSVPTVKRGEGWGPAEINLLPLYSQTPLMPQPAELTNYQRLLQGNAPWEGRYGSSAVPGTPASLDPLCANKLFLCGDKNYWDFSAVNNAGSYGSPWDLSGTGLIGLDNGGRPRCANTTMGTSLANNPYQFNLSSNVPKGAPSGTTINNPFSVSELERLLRPFDHDTLSLPNRLNQFVPYQDRHLITTESWDLPLCPSLPLALTSTFADKHMTHLIDLLIAKGIPETMWRQLLPPEVIAGRKYDLNRPFGNGLDDNANGGVDEPYPVEPNEQVSLYSNPLLPKAGYHVSYDPAGTVNSSGQTIDPDTNNPPLAGISVPLKARQLQARYLYVMAMLLMSTAERNELGDRLDAIGQPKKVASDPNNEIGVARFLAQWAVNVVSFRDRNSIMIPFEYDIDPFTATGWRVDGILGTNPADGTSDDAQMYRGLVWGCKRPELLISETLAFHDRRTQDLMETAVDTTETNDPTQKEVGKTTETEPDKKDISFDQSYRPQGSLFIELYNPWSRQDATTGDIHDSTTGAVLLNKMSGLDPTGAATPTPVWRIAVVRPESDPDSPLELRDPDHPEPSKRPALERTIYFVNGNLPADGVLAHYYPSRTPSAPIIPGGYAVIGPGDSNPASPSRTKTYLGFKFPLNVADTHPLDSRCIDMMAAFPVTNNPGNQPPDPTDPTTWQAPGKLVPVIIDSPIHATTNGPEWRLSVTEPVGGYESHIPLGVEYNAPTEQYRNATSSILHIFDQPFDKEHGDPLLLKDQTIYCYRVLHLQRLANPHVPYNAVTNPYLTIDTMSVDVTAFNGLKDTTDDPDPLAAGISPSPVIASSQFLASRQRGENNSGTLSGASDTNVLWKQEPATKQLQGGNADVLSPDCRNPATNVANHSFNEGLKHSLGYLNRSFGDPIAPGTPPEPGLPASPFPWLNWNNRPYISEMELLQVPVWRSSKLLANAYNPVSDRDDDQKGFDRYYRILKTGDSAKPYDASQPNEVPYPHLPGFFESAATSGGAPVPELHRILGFVGVSSPFVGAEIQANPSNLNVWGDPGAHFFHPPFNRIPLYREPGKINLNTIYDAKVFFGLMNNHPGLNDQTAWEKFVSSRRGYGLQSLDILTPSSAVPTQFAAPFRSAGSSHLVSPTPGFGGSDSRALVYDREISATLLRAIPNQNNAHTTGDKPLFQSADSPLLQASDNTDRNPYFRYLGLERLANLTTTRSNVYAVWITVGYFEVTPWGTVDAGHPDGYQLGQELGSDTGEIQRHRAFYIFDRSIPVGFERGQDLNVEKAILLKRFIE